MRTGTHEFNLALGVRWCEILNCYPVEWAIFMEMMVVGSKTQQYIPKIGDTGCPSWNWDRGGASSHILEM